MLRRRACETAEHALAMVSRRKPAAAASNCCAAAALLEGRAGGLVFYQELGRTTAPGT